MNSYSLRLTLKTWKTMTMTWKSQILNRHINPILVLGIMLFAVLSGCASVNVAQVEDGDEVKGPRYYAAHPYVLIAQTDEGTLQTAIVWLPDYETTYEIRRKRGLGKATLSATFTDGGMLKSFGTEHDPQVASTLQAAMGGILGALGAGAPTEEEAPAEGPPNANLLDPGLYKLVFRHDDGSLRDVPVLKLVTLSDSQPLAVQSETGESADPEQ
jgi:uncharacterized protein YceK